MGLVTEQPRVTLAGLFTGNGWRTGLVLAAFAVAVQAVFLLETADSLIFRYPLLDAATYYQQALDILAGKGTPGAFWQPPGYPCFLAGISRLAGTDLAAIRSAQALLLAPVAALLLWRVGRRVLSPGWAFAASIAACLTGPLLFYHSQLLAAATAATLITAAMLLALRAREQPSTLRWLAAGLTVGCAALVVATTAVLLPVLVMFAWCDTAPRRARFLRVAAVIAGLLAVTAPVVIRNHAICGRWVWISANSGTNFYLGNNRNWERTLTAMPELDWNQLLRRPFLQSQVRSAAGADHQFQHMALQEARQNPAAFAARLARKSLVFWHGREIPRNIDIYGWRDQSMLLCATVWRAGICFPNGLLVPLALVGAVALRRRREGQLLVAGIVVFGLLVSLYFPCSRYRVPVLPLVVVLACAGAQALQAAVRERRWQVAGALATLACVAGVAANAPLHWPTDRVRYDAHLWYAVGAGAGADGDLDTARMCYQKALEIDPQFADVQFNLGTLYARQQDAARAEACYEAALVARPDHDKARANLALLLAARGQDESALQQLLRAESDNPLNAEAFFRHAALLLRLGRKDEALVPLNRATAFNPDYLIQYRALETAGH